jgi:hypothetical protein
MDNEADARRATSLLYHVASAVALAWAAPYPRDARRCAAAVVVAHGDRASRLSNDPFRLTENAAHRAIADHLLGDRDVGMAEVGELLKLA